MVQNETKNMSKQQRKRVIFASVFTAFSLILLCLDWVSIARNDYEQIMRKKRLVWITEDEPWGFDPHRKDTMGFHYELIKAYADSMGLELEVNVIRGRNEQLKALQNRKAHLLAADVLLTEDIKKQFATCQLPYTAQIYLIQTHHPEQYVEDVAQLQGKQLLIPSDDAYRLRVHHLMEELEIDLQMHMPKNTTEGDVLRAVKNGEQPYALCLNLRTKLWESAHPDLDFTQRIGYDQPCGWLVHKHEKHLQLSLQRFLTWFATTPEYRQLYQKYFSVSPASGKS